VEGGGTIPCSTKVETIHLHMEFQTSKYVIASHPLALLLAHMSNKSAAKNIAVFEATITNCLNLKSIESRKRSRAG
jgi:hypothetical protein